jgi:hypothetical protein
VGDFCHAEQTDGAYAQQARSPAFPFLLLEEVQNFLSRRDETDETTWARWFRDWVRTLRR